MVNDMSIKLQMDSYWYNNLLVVYGKVAIQKRYIVSALFKANSASSFVPSKAAIHFVLGFNSKIIRMTQKTLKCRQNEWVWHKQASSTN